MNLKPNRGAIFYLQTDFKQNISAETKLNISVILIFCFLLIWDFVVIIGVLELPNVTTHWFLILSAYLLAFGTLITNIGFAYSLLHEDLGFPKTILSYSKDDLELNLKTKLFGFIINKKSILLSDIEFIQLLFSEKYNFPLDYSISLVFDNSLHNNICLFCTNNELEAVSFLHRISLILKTKEKALTVTNNKLVPFNISQITNDQTEKDIINRKFNCFNADGKLEICKVTLTPQNIIGFIGITASNNQSAPFLSFFVKNKENEYKEFFKISSLEIVQFNICGNACAILTKQDIKYNFTDCISNKIKKLKYFLKIATYSS